MSINFYLVYFGGYGVTKGTNINCRNVHTINLYYYLLENTTCIYQISMC